jgi:hypothetical protein
MKDDTAYMDRIMLSLQVGCAKNQQRFTTDHFGLCVTFFQNVGAPK